MVTHQHVDLEVWTAGYLRKELGAIPFQQPVRVNTNHSAGVCLETRTTADAATVRSLIEEAVRRHHTSELRHRRELKHNRLARRTP